MEPQAGPTRDAPPPRPRPPAARTSALLLVAALLPGLILLRAVHRCAVDVPFMDDWQFVSLIEKVHGGEIPWRELAAPHDEHRLLIPRVVIVASALLSHGNYRVQCFVTVAVVALLSLALLALLRRTLGPGPRSAFAWLLANCILFSPIQWHNWLWPMQFCYFLPFVFLGLGLLAFYSDLSAGPRFGLALASAWAATFSFVQGLLVWPVMLWVVLRDGRFASPRARRLYGAAWLASGALAYFLYFDGLFRNSADPAYAYLHKGVPPTSSTLRLLGQDPLGTLGRMVGFALTMFGNAVARGLPVASNLRLAALAGLLLAGAAVALCVALRRRGGLEGASFAWMALCVHAFATAGLVGLGRVWAGPGQPLTPRYATFGTFCLLSVAMLAVLWLGQGDVSQAVRERAWLACGALFALLGVNWVYGLNLMGEWRDVQTSARAAVHFSQRLAVPSLHLAGGRRRFLNRAITTLDRLGYWNPPLARDLRLDQFKILDEIPAAHGRVAPLRPGRGGAWLARGHAHHGLGLAPDAILVTSADGTGSETIRAFCETYAPPRWQRHAYQRDFEFVDRAQKRSYGFFSCRLDPAMVPPGESRRLRFWALDFAGRAVHRVLGEATLPAAAPPDAAVAP
jgi:hypothetical protein